MWPGLPSSSFPRPPSLLWLSHTLFSCLPKPARQSDESSGVCGHRWTRWSQVRGTQGPSWPLRCSPALCYLSSHVSVHFVSTFCSLSQNQTSPPLCRGSHQGSAFCGLISWSAQPGLSSLPYLAPGSSLALSSLPSSWLSRFTSKGSLSFPLHGVTSNAYRFSVPGSSSSSLLIHSQHLPSMEALPVLDPLSAPSLATFAASFLATFAASFSLALLGSGSYLSWASPHASSFRCDPLFTLPICSLLFKSVLGRGMALEREKR